MTTTIRTRAAVVLGAILTAGLLGAASAGPAVLAAGHGKPTAVLAAGHGKPTAVLAAGHGKPTAVLAAGHGKPTVSTATLL